MMERNEKTIAFVKEHHEDDVRALALQARRDNDVDLTWALEQIQGWQTARRKLPSWSVTDGIIYPHHLSMEQCSSEQTALYKCDIVEQQPQACLMTLIDLTGGFGVDFAFMAKGFEQAIYVERQEALCKTARHNFGLLGLNHAHVIHAEAEEFLHDLVTEPTCTLIYLDPARRDQNSNRTYAIDDCTPNVLELLGPLFKAADHVLLKLSPMLDWHKAIKDLGEHVAEVHIVSVNNECKELLVFMSADHKGEPSIHCVNDGQSLIYRPLENAMPPAIATDDETAGSAYLYEPNASIMKAGCFGVLTGRYHVKAISIDSHLFVSEEFIEDFPGRRFAVTAITTMNKKELAHALSGITRANVATRNFPMSAQQLRSRLRLQDGGDCYIFGSTTATGQRLLYLCKKM